MQQISAAEDLYPLKALLIINPVSGKKAVLRHISPIVRSLMDQGYLVTTAVTSRKGEAAELSARYAADFDLICCTGGDGTLNETLSGIASVQADVPLGYIPCGSTNDFAASHALSTDIETAAKRMAGGDVRKYDIARFGDRYFSYVAAFGAFSWLSYTTDQNLKNVLGHTAYILDAIKDLYKIRPMRMKLVANGITYDDEFIFGAVCNTTSIAGTIELPGSVVDTGDGKLEVLLIKMPKTVIDLDMIIRGIVTQDYSGPFLEFFQTSELDIHNPDMYEWSLDGECFPPCESLHVSVMPEFLKLKS